MPTVLWIEDQVDNDLPDVYAAAVAAGYSLTIATDATSALHALATKQFDYVIVDIRIEPGADPRWQNYYYDQCTGNSTIARLGIQLLRSIWNANPEKGLELAPAERDKLAWLTPARVGLFTIESLEEVKRDLEDLKLPESHQLRKQGEGDPTRRLVVLLEQLKQENQPRERAE